MPWGAVCKTDNTSVILERWFAGRFCQESNGAAVDIGSYILNVSSLLGWWGGTLGLDLTCKWGRHYVYFGQCVLVIICITLVFIKEGKRFILLSLLNFLTLKWIHSHWNKFGMKRYILKGQMVPNPSPLSMLTNYLDITTVNTLKYSFLEIYEVYLTLTLIHKTLKYFLFRNLLGLFS